VIEPQYITLEMSAYDTGDVDGSGNDRMKCGYFGRLRIVLMQGTTGRKGNGRGKFSFHSKHVNAFPLSLPLSLRKLGEKESKQCLDSIQTALCNGHT
jgi:hypothetical protein